MYIVTLKWNSMLVVDKAEQQPQRKCDGIEIIDQFPDALHAHQG